MCGMKGCALEGARPRGVTIPMLKDLSSLKQEHNAAETIKKDNSLVYIQAKSRASFLY